MLPKKVWKIRVRGDLRGINLLLLVLACIWLARLLFVFTKAVSNMMHEEF